ncbi:hypothetical protein LEP1GSC151_1533 [Leptospira interrogans serovar Grippotyphosa str. LT2186]|uniref:Uncharacterized protein n=4 Tax=Leptospira interrogans TaxID=173 RepID=M3GQ96_LEPIR|nr:hypothetical protein G436_1636 [Leptospira interrogans serovar Hardjo str. Norma]EKO25980.1 hypothetical protein LEP1GSC104_1805 [Leptospira interrogans str. UI 12621]EKO85115.1 hypothetical protein LEP1GSC009_1384 [Leptospira interrogans serovar Grippotyphosa str. Andaman]EKO95494.1 hypothetical protein LEP1GSC057_1098 [Leptospira interrogans str. Brem 329]EKP85201.1 hypothetical protein LEP1GSC020_4099 [Leptospira interrogans serovar Grippotyphosa str. 2006006986]EKR46925.1 hypothetical p
MFYIHLGLGEPYVREIRKFFLESQFIKMINPDFLVFKD